MALDKNSSHSNTASRDISASEVGYRSEKLSDTPQNNAGIGAFVQLLYAGTHDLQAG